MERKPSDALPMERKPSDGLTMERKPSDGLPMERQAVMPSHAAPSCPAALSWLDDGLSRRHAVSCRIDGASSRQAVSYRAVMPCRPLMA